MVQTSQATARQVMAAPITARNRPNSRRGARASAAMGQRREQVEVPSTASDHKWPVIAQWSQVPRPKTL